MARLTLTPLRFDILEDGVGGFALRLNAVAEIEELSRVILVGASLGHWWNFPVHNRLLLVLLLGIALRNGLTGRGLEDKFEDLKGVGILGSGSGDTEGVSRWEFNLLNSQY